MNPKLLKLMAENLRIGIAGAGGFAHFAANVFSRIPGVSIHSCS
jgi:hypothetical protein